MSEPLVVAQIEIRLGSVVRYKYFAVLKGTHRAGINIQIRVKFLQSNAKSPALEQTTDGGGGDSLAQRRNNAAGHENVFSQFVYPC